MADSSDPSDERSVGGEADLAEEIRTVAFRMREIQRLLSVRVEQENRRLEADGLDPVEESRFLESSEKETE